MNPANLLAQLQRQIKEDPKRATILAVLVIVMGVMWARLALSGKSQPATAEASIDSSLLIAPSVPVDSTRRPGLSVHAEELTAWTRLPVQPVRRNLFAVNLTYYRRDGSTGSPSAGSQGFWQELAKSQSQTTDLKKARQIQIENVEQLASQIKLQSTMMGAAPKAMANGKLVGVGDIVSVDAAGAVATFRVLGVGPRSMIVEHEGIRLEISMN